MVLTNDDELAERCRLARNLFFSPKKRYVHEELGYNFRMTNMQAALGVAQLEKLEATVCKKRHIGRLYNELLTDVKGLQLPVAHTNYAENTKVTRLPEEYQKVVSKLVADSCNRIEKQIYHFECQSTNDGNMILRMVEYDFMIALVDSLSRKDKKKIRFPRSCIIYLRATKNTLSEELMEIEMADGQTFTYRVPIIKLKEYSIDEIFEKNLLILLPYYIINYEKDISEIAEDKMKTEKLVLEYKRIISRLEEATKADETGLFWDIVKMMQRVMRYLLREESELKERMGDVMGGKVLSLPSDRLREERNIGISQGISQTISALIETCKEFHVTKEDTVARIVEKFAMSKEDALDLVEKYWN